MNKIYIKHSLAALLLGVSFASYSQIITTIAGDSAAGYSGDGGLATLAELNGPAGIAEDVSGNIYVADQINNSIRMVNTAGIISTFAGNGTADYSGDGGQATDAELNSPYGITIGISGNLYISDWINNRVRIVNTSGVINTFAGNGYGAPAIGGFSGDGGQATDAELYLPSDVKLDNSGNVYIADEVNDRIRMVNTSGIISTIAGDSSQGYAGDGGQATAAELNFPTGIYVDPAATIYIADQRNNCIRLVSTSGTIGTFAGNGIPGFFGDGGPATAAEMLFPYGIVADTSGNVFISDAGNSRIRRVNSSGIINTAVGINFSGYSGDGGPPAAAEINNPLGILFDTAHNLIFADAGNNRVREVIPPVTTGKRNVKSISDEMNIYPIPNTGYFTVSGVLQGQIIEFYNYLGEMVETQYIASQQSNIHFDISNYSNGIYLIRILNKDGSVVAEKKIVKTE